MRGERGFALVIALIVTTLLVALLVEFVGEVYVDTSHSHNFVASQQAGILAESGIAGGVALLKASAAMRQAQGIDASSLSEMWATPFNYDAGVGTVTITIEDESGKLDLNSATSDTGAPDIFYVQTAERLVKQLQLSHDLLDAASDWRDLDDTPRPNGAETSYYSTLKPPYQAHNGRFNTFEELGLVKGFTPPVLTKLRSCLTVYGSELSSGRMAAQININTAPKELLAALDDKLMTGDMVNQILEYRKTKPIKTLNDVAGLEKLVQLIGKVSFKGSIYRIHAEGKVGESVSVAEAVVSNVEQPKPTVLYWREY